MRTTRYFDLMRKRPDRAVIMEEWIERAIHAPIREYVQADGRPPLDAGAGDGGALPPG